MPATRRIDAYPHALYEILENVLLTQKEAKIDLADAKAVARLRFKVYALRRALMDSPDHPLKDIAVKIATLTEGNTLIVLHEDYTPQATLLKRIAEGL